MKFLLDTNVISESRRKRPDPAVRKWLDDTDPEALHVSVLTLGEIAKGVAAVSVRDRQAARVLDHWLDFLGVHFAGRILPIDAVVAMRWGTLSAARPLPVADALLAATASVHGMTLVTRNLKDLRGTGVAMLNPWDGDPSA